MVFFAFIRLEITLKGSLKLLNKFPLSNPAMFNPTILYPACGTFSISIFPFAPMNKNSAFGNLFLISSAMATAGKMCPPVPPPLMRIRGAGFGLRVFVCCSWFDIYFFDVATSWLFFGSCLLFHWASTNAIDFGTSYLFCDKPILIHSRILGALRAFIVTRYRLFLQYFAFCPYLLRRTPGF